MRLRLRFFKHHTYGSNCLQPERVAYEYLLNSFYTVAVGKKGVSRNLEHRAGKLLF